MIETKSLDDLFNDECFLSDLREGKFCLVLGAGFSFGIDEKNRIKNRVVHSNPIYQNIPTTTDFINITKNEFDRTSLNFQDAATLWEQSFKTDKTKVDLFRNLFLVDESDFKEKHLKKYKEIFTPNWYRIFTFNIDNVLESSDKNKEYHILSYPTDKEFRHNAFKQIAHIHGRITEASDITNLIFFGMKYAELQDSDNSLYYALVNPIISENESKNLIVLGCQFNENIQLQKFYRNISGTPRPRIYQIGREEPLVSGERANYDYTFLKATTFDFLQKIIENKTKIENIQIEGATVITKDFIKEIEEAGKKENYKPDDFYLAKQYDYCQWFGILNNWDIERDAYQKIKEDVKKSFEDEYRLPKISSLIYGRGGCGKSTLLRRLAIDLINEDFAVLWINDKEINTFRERGLAQLLEYSHKPFLILIEDWYRIKQNTDKAKEIINSICSYSNVRIVIGDRNIDNSISLEHFYNPDENIIELKTNENNATLKQILKKVPHWKAAASKLLVSPNDYDSSLYLILWTIARYYHVTEGEKPGKIKTENLIGHFRSIVESDLRAIVKHFPGVAKMLFYWACSYSIRKIYIGYDLFFILSDLFKQSTDSDSKLILASSKVRSILDIYMQRSRGVVKSAKELSLIAFNHDLLADEGLSKARLEGWQEFDDSIILKILPVIIEKGDDFSASNFLLFACNLIKPLYFSEQEKRKYFEKLISKSNFQLYLQIAFKSKYIFNPSEKVEISKKILLQPEFWELPKDVVTTAMNISNDTVTNDKASRDILSQNEFWKLPQEIVSIAMNISSEITIKDNAARNIFSQNEFWKLPKEIVSIAMNISSDIIIKNKAARDILSQNEFWRLPHQIVSAALNVSSSSTKHPKADILSHPEFWRIHPQIVSTAMNISTDPTITNKAAREILSQDELWKLPFEIISTALKNSTETTFKQERAIAILNNWRNYDSTVIFRCLYIVSELNTLPDFVIKIVNAIISEKHDKTIKDKTKYFRYTNLMKIPFHSISSWAKSSRLNIAQWERRYRAVIVNSIIAYRLYPEAIETMCSSILKNWSYEIKIPITQRHGILPHYGDHVKLSLAHPSLRTLARKTAIQMQNEETKKNGTIPAHLLIVIKQMITENKYPEWSFNKKDE